MIETFKILKDLDKVGNDDEDYLQLPGSHWSSLGNHRTQPERPAGRQTKQSTKVGKMIEKVLSRLPVGKRQVQQLQLWMPSLSFFGAGAAALGLYITDWQLINQFIPFYGTKYKEQEEE
ncbi:hypothetical protein Pmani_036786 [Petrolisthes manimaculis]|uniref:Cytochrome b-c1 complex subunit 10 n=1 Tax=Petrolisthes manimaculis TaxID=1843537 RepID=A0AAE1NJH7_9EUCA|nr:hypothetical protein Pmani_036786 [Petrolisthes manimaculis]